MTVNSDSGWRSVAGSNGRGHGDFLSLVTLALGPDLADGHLPCGGFGVFFQQVKTRSPFAELAPARRAATRTQNQRRLRNIAIIATATTPQTAQNAG